jgi:hypothetical protein
MRTRYFQVVIEADQVQDGSWGFTDNTNTWDDRSLNLLG